MGACNVEYGMGLRRDSLLVARQMRGGVEKRRRGERGGRRHYTIH